jgi:hypothetical protein
MNKFLLLCRPSNDGIWGSDARRSNEHKWISVTIFPRWKAGDMARCDELAGMIFQQQPPLLPFAALCLEVLPKKMKKWREREKN